MEYVAHKKSVRKWKRNNKNKQKRRIVKSEVRKAKRRKLKIEKSCLPGKEQLHSLTSFGAMEAQTFWENYNTAQEWQQRSVSVFFFHFNSGSILLDFYK